MRAAIYDKASTFDQDPENQLQELRRYLEARGWAAVEYVDRGVSGSKDRRPALDQLVPMPAAGGSTSLWSVGWTVSGAICAI
jgi:DNA invertase Pin-like site-specific DNA recombinase